MWDTRLTAATAWAATVWWALRTTAGYAQQWVSKLVLGWVTKSLQVGKPSWKITSEPGQLSLAIHPRVSAMSTSRSWDINRHTARCISPIFVVLQCKLVSGWALRKERSVPPCGLCGLGTPLHSVFYVFLLHFRIRSATFIILQTFCGCCCGYMVYSWNAWLLLL